MPKDRRATIRIKTYEVTIIRFRTGDDNADVLAYEQPVAEDAEMDVSSSSEPDSKLLDESNEQEAKR